MEEHKQAVESRRRRSGEEIQELVARFEASSLSRVEFCRTTGVSLASLARYRKRQRGAELPTGGRFLAVEVMSSTAAANSAGLVVALRGGRRIEIGRGFDARTLVQLVSTLERL